MASLAIQQDDEKKVYAISLTVRPDKSPHSAAELGECLGRLMGRTMAVADRGGEEKLFTLTLEGNEIELKTAEGFKDGSGAELGVDPNGRYARQKK
ncbi:hypothetical protein [Cloacibacillus sp.]